MTVTTTSNKIIYNGNGATTVFGFAFPGVAAADLQVYYTDTNGVITLLSPTLYSVALNPITGTNPTAVGGSVTYPLVGSPIAVGTMLTIIRELPVTQNTSLDNQGTLWQPVIEAALDYLTMVEQQFIELLNRQITVAVSDPNPLALPPVAQRANKYFAFDGSGNPIAASAQAGTAIVSSAMVPVVSAATLALARTAMGLGNVAVENIGAGLQDDGAGSLRVNFGLTADAVNQAVGAAFHDTHRVATGPITYTLARANTLWNGFGFWVNALSGLITFTPNASDSIQGQASGSSYAIPRGARAWVYTDAAASGNWYIDIYQENAGPAQVGMLNGQIVESHLGGAATFAIKTALGNDPTAADPVYFIFRDSNAALGDFVIRQVTGALAVTIPSTALVGFSNAVAGRLWITAFDNAGTVVLAVINCRNGTNIFPLAGWGIASAVAIDATADNASIFYGSVVVATQPYITLGYASYETGLATAGSWVVAPTRIQLLGAGVPLPGAVIQPLRTTSGALATGTTTVPVDDTIPQITEGDQYFSQAITPSSLCNVIEMEAQGFFASGGGGMVVMSLFQDAIANALATVASSLVSTVTVSELRLSYAAIPGQTSPTTYRIRAGSSAAGTTTLNGSAGARLFGGAFNSFLSVTERMA